MKGISAEGGAIKGEFEGGFKGGIYRRGITEKFSIP